MSRRRPQTLAHPTALIALAALAFTQGACFGEGASSSASGASSGGDDPTAVEVFGDCTPKMPEGYPPILVFIADPVEGAPRYLAGKTLPASHMFSFKVPAPMSGFLEAHIVTDANKNGGCDDSETVVTTKGPPDHRKVDLGSQADYPLHSTICPQVLTGHVADAP